MYDRTLIILSGPFRSTLASNVTVNVPFAALLRLSVLCLPSQQEAHNVWVLPVRVESRCFTLKQRNQHKAGYIFDANV